MNEAVEGTILSITSRRVVPNGGPDLSVSYDSACFMKVFDLIHTWAICVQTWSKVLIFRYTFVNSWKKYWCCCIHSKIKVLGFQKSTPISRIRNWMAVVSREVEGQCANPG